MEFKVTLGSKVGKGGREGERESKEKEEARKETENTTSFLLSRSPCPELKFP